MKELTDMKLGKLCFGFFILAGFSLFSFSSLVRANEWSPHLAFTSPPPTFTGEIISPPQIGIDGKGNVIAAWASEESGLKVVKAARFDAQTKEWSHLEKIGGDHAENPQLAVNKGGRAIAAWKSISEAGSFIMFNTYDIKQSKWKEPKVIDPASPNQGHPSVGIDSLGNAVIVWQDKGDDSLGGVIRSASYSFLTSSITSISDISTDYSLTGNRVVGQPAVEMNPSGTAVAVWRYFDNGSTYPYRIQSNTYQAALWAGEEDVSASQSTAFILPKVIVCSSGDAMAFWMQKVSNYYTVTASVKMRQKRWSSMTSVSALGYLKDPMSAEKGPYLADAGYDGLGNVIIVWNDINESMDPPEYKIQAKTFQNSSWGPRTTISDVNLSSGFVKIAVGHYGDAYALFIAGYGNLHDKLKLPSFVQASKYSKAMNSWSTPELISKEGFNFFPNVAVNFQGNFSVIWGNENSRESVLNISSTFVKPPSLPLPEKLPLPKLPPRPRKLRVRQVDNRFATHTERVNIISWELPKNGIKPVTYKIYRDPELKELIGTVPAKKKMSYQERYCKKNAAYQYYIIAIDEDGRKSIPVAIIIEPKK
jgi:hypothetical protein